MVPPRIRIEKHLGTYQEQGGEVVFRHWNGEQIRVEDAAKIIGELLNKVLPLVEIGQGIKLVIEV